MIVGVRLFLAISLERAIAPADALVMLTTKANPGTAKSGAAKYARRLAWAFIASTVGIFGGLVAGLFVPILIYRFQGSPGTYFDSGLWMASIVTAPIGAILGGLVMARMAMRPRA